MPRPVPSLLACLALALGLALPARAPADPPGAAGEPLTVAMDAGHAPYTLLDAAGRPAGLFVDIWTLWSRKTGRPVRFAPAPREEALAAVPAGRADIHAGRIDTPELREGQDLSSPFYHLSLHLFVLSGPDAPRDLEALAGRRVGAGPGAFPLEALHQVLPRAEAAAFADLDAGFTALASGRIRALLAEAEPGRLAMTRLGLSGAVEAREMHLGGQVRAMVGRGKPGLLALVDRGLAAISEEEYAALEARWIGNPSERIHRPGSGRIHLSPAEQEFLRRHPLLTLGVGNAMPPLMWVEDEAGQKAFKGLVADYLRLLGERLGVRLDLRLDLSFNEALERARTGEVDLLPALERTPERARFLSFTAPYLVFPSVIVTRTDAPFVAGLPDLAGKTAAEVPWLAGYAWLTREYPDIRIHKVSSVSDAFRAVSFGQADACIANLAVAGYWIPRLGLANLKVAAPTGHADSEWRMGVRDGLEPLAGILEKALASLTPAEREEMRRRWLPVQVEPAYASRRIWRAAMVAAGAGTAALALVLLWTRQIRLREERFKGLTEQGRDITLAFTPAGDIVYQSPSLRTQLGHDPAELAGARVESLFHPGDLPALEQARAALAQGADTTGLTHRLRCRDGSWRDFESNLADLTANRALRALVLHGRDVTSRRAAEQALRESETRYVLALSAAGAGAWDRNLVTGDIVWSDNVEPMFGLIPGTFGRTYADFLALVHPADREAVVEAGRRCLSGDGEYRAEYRVLRPDGRECWILARGDVVRDRAGEPVRLLGVLQDVTERRRLEADLLRLATQDELTRLPNRRHFLEQARREVERARRYGSALSLLMVDADHFKDVNDTYGHAGGDAVLRALAETGRRLLREADLLGRLGGEEFALLLPETDLDQAVVVAERLRGAVRSLAVPVPGGGEAAVTVSVGVAALGPEVESLDELMRRADGALYAAKDRGRDRVEAS